MIKYMISNQITSSFAVKTAKQCAFDRIPAEYAANHTAVQCIFKVALALDS